MSIDLQPPPTAAPGSAARARLAECLLIADPQCGTAAIEGERAASEAMALAASLDATTEQGRAAAWRCAHLLRLGRNDELQSLARMHLPLMTAPALAEDRFELMRLLTLSAAESGAHELAQDIAHQMVREARDEHPGQALVAAYALSLCHERMGDSWQALRVATAALQAAGPQAPGTALLIVQNLICVLLIGHFHRLRDVAEAAEVRELLERAREAGERALAQQIRLNNAFYSVATAANLGEVRLHLGELEAAEELLTRARQLATAQGAVSYEWRVRSSQADWLLAAGRAQDAAQAAEDLIIEMGSTPPTQTSLRAHQAAYRAYRALGDTARALDHLERAEWLERRNQISQLRSRSVHFVTRAEAQRAESQAERDPLTALGNRRYTARRWSELSAEGELRQPLALAQLDIDHFKRINDGHGHAIGDRVLVALAGLLRAHLRAGDVVSRHGGEEFLLLLPGLDAEQGAETCERLRERVAAHDWTEAVALPPGAAALSITISIGIAAAPPYDLPLLMERADEALYRAKREGRNCVRNAA